MRRNIPIDANDFLICLKNPQRSATVVDRLNKIEMRLILAIITILGYRIFMYSYKDPRKSETDQSWSPILTILTTI